MHAPAAAAAAVPAAVASRLARTVLMTGATIGEGSTVGVTCVGVAVGAGRGGGCWRRRCRYRQRLLGDTDEVRDGLDAVEDAAHRARRSERVRRSAGGTDGEDAQHDSRKRTGITHERHRPTRLLEEVPAQLLPALLTPALAGRRYVDACTGPRQARSAGECRFRIVGNARCRRRRRASLPQALALDHGGFEAETLVHEPPVSGRKAWLHVFSEVAAQGFYARNCSAKTAFSFFSMHCGDFRRGLGQEEAQDDRVLLLLGQVLQRREQVQVIEQRLGIAGIDALRAKAASRWLGLPGAGGRR